MQVAPIAQTMRRGFERDLPPTPSAPARIPLRALPLCRGSVILSFEPGAGANRGEL